MYIGYKILKFLGSSYYPVMIPCSSSSQCMPRKSFELRRSGSISLILRQRARAGKWKGTSSYDVERFSDVKVQRCLDIYRQKGARLKCELWDQVHKCHTFEHCHPCSSHAINWESVIDSIYFPFPDDISNDLETKAFTVFFRYRVHQKLLDFSIKQI